MTQHPPRCCGSCDVSEPHRGRGLDRIMRPPAERRDAWQPSLHFTTPRLEEHDANTRQPVAGQHNLS
jgi:hypothetical protein